MASKGLFGLISLILVAGGVLLMLLIALTGAVDGAPVNKWYFLEANTAGIPNAPSVSRWTYWNVCAREGSRTACGNKYFSKVHPAFPLDPPGHKTFRTHVDVPKNFIGTSFYFLTTRFMFSFMLIALFFGVCALFTGLLALCTRLGAYLSGLTTMIAAFFQAINAALMTAAYIKGRNNFRKNHQAAHIGKYAFAFEWAALACYLLATVFFCLGGSSRKDKSTHKSSSNKSFFNRTKRSKSTRSQGSFINSNKEYS